MEIKVHQGQPSGIQNNFASGESLLCQSLPFCACKKSSLFRLLHHPLVGADEETSRADCRIMDCEIRFLPEIRFHAADNATNGLARCEILSRSFFLLSIFLEEALVGIGLNVHVERSPLRLINQADQFLQIDRLTEL